LFTLAIPPHGPQATCPDHPAPGPATKLSPPGRPRQGENAGGALVGWTARLPVLPSRPMDTDTADRIPPPPGTLEGALEVVQAALDYRFKDPALLADALRILFPPLTPEAAARRQRLEFLGDAAWDCAAAWTACSLWPEASVGEL